MRRILYRCNERYGVVRAVILSFLTSLFPVVAWAQQAVVYGSVRDDSANPLSNVSIQFDEEKIFFTDADGRFEVPVPSGRPVKLLFSHIGFETFERTVLLQPGQRYPLYVVMVPRLFLIDSVVVENRALRSEPGLVKLSPGAMQYLPSAGGGVEAMLKVLGAQSGNELSAQYSVRGGNYDENLVYVNDFEIFRPTLVRSSQQEGLSFIHTQLVESVFFSTGGFAAHYGDKMSSVLDVRYKRPEKFGGNAEMSLLGGAASLEGVGLRKRLRYLWGGRYKTNRYLLSSLDTKGEYQPLFTDVQGNVQLDLSSRSTLEAIGNFSGNIYRFIPEDRVTTFGTIQRTLRLNVYFDGQEVDRYFYGMGGLAWTLRPTSHLKLKVMAAMYRSQEEETFDIIGQYFLGEVSNDFGSSAFGQTLYYLGVGTTHQWARLVLNSTIYRLSHKATLTRGAHVVQWGFDASHELLSDQINEWVRLDSAGYTLPYSDQQLVIPELIKGRYELSSARLAAYMEDTWRPVGPFSLRIGTRISYWDLNGQWLVSPRLQWSYDPAWKADIIFKAAFGFYDQPPFYRELRNLEGELQRNVLAQRSIHYVAGLDYNFSMWQRRFHFVSELYYKHLMDLNPYELDNVRIRYFGTNTAKGYAAGMDFRLHGEFVPGAESWVAMSLLKTKENLLNDVLYRVDTIKSGEPAGIILDSVPVYPGYIPRPTDQLLNFSLFFQDYLPGNERFKVHLNLLFGTGLPTGPPDNIRARDTIRLAPYRRVDIGFSAMVHDATRKTHRSNVLGRHVQTAWISVEVFNLLGVFNEISYTWVKDFSNMIYAVPNYLTGRRINVRLHIRF